MLKLVFNPISGQFDYVDVTTPSTSSYWGSFYDTTTQTISSTTTEYPVTMNTTVGGNGVAIGSPTSRVVFSNAGVYSITFSLQFDNSGADDQLATVWIKKNGTNVTDSASVTSIPKKHGSDNGAIITTINYVLDLQANDYIQVYWRADSTNVRLVTVAAGSSPTRPLSPSIIYTATLVNAIGAKGDTGATGSAGAKGDTGVKGDTGSGGSATLAGLSDVNISTPLSTNFLKYDGASSKWINADIFYNIDGGSSSSVYLASQIIDGGNA